jgi:cardiolipin synthase
VRVLVDGGGNLLFGRRHGTQAFEVNRALSVLAQQPYVEVLRTHNAFAQFDHRKLLLVDGRVAWTGGRNFVYRSFAEQHDLSFVLAGPLAHRLADRFDRYWHEQGGATVEAGQPEEDGGQPATAVTMLPPPNAWARLLRTEPGAHELEQVLYQAVDQARQHIYLENVYFFDSRLLSKLAQARRRGADVRVVLTIASTNPVINRANRVVANRLRRDGVRIYLYPGMTHVKAGAIDGCWAYLGTGNFDALSLRHNRETGIAIRNGEVIEELEERLLLADCRGEWEMTEPFPASLADDACALLAGLCL